MAKMRNVVVEKTDNKYALRFTHTFDSEKVKDSEALHTLLCEVDPGETYSIRFFNVTEVG